MNSSKAFPPQPSSGGDPCLDLWGKDPDDPYPLIGHLLDTAVVSEFLYEHWLRPGLRGLLAERIGGGNHELTRRVVMLLGGLHDCGKATPVFQLQDALGRDQAWRQGLRTKLVERGLPSADPSVVAVAAAEKTVRRHEYLGLVSLLGRHPGSSDKSLLASDWAALVVGGHHGRWLRTGVHAPPAIDAQVSGPWHDQQRAHVGVVEQAVGLRLTDLPALRPADAPSTIVLLTGLVILADWLASDERRVSTGKTLARAGHRLDATWIDLRREEFTTHARATLGRYQAPRDPVSTILGPHSPRPLQQSTLDEIGGRDGLWLVAYPTGEGKTEAALLRHTSRTDEGLIFALPTRATTDAMTRRLRERVFAGTGNHVVKSHQFAAAEKLSDGCGDSDAGYDTAWFTTSIRRLVAPVSATTCDQVLTGALRQKHSALRLLALANHHVVLDEVHTFDAFQVELLVELLAWLGATNTRVTLLSATMPTWMQDRLAGAYSGQDKKPGLPYPGHGLVDAGSWTTPVTQPGELRLETHLCDDSSAAHIQWARASAVEHPGAHLAILVNTVTDCLKVATGLEGIDADVLCLHSRMMQGDRVETEQALVDRAGPYAEPTRRRIVLVSTQVAEASLDFDVDLMSTDLSPAPSLVQRAGRLWRFADPTARLARLAHSSNPPHRTLRVVTRVSNGAITQRTALPYLSAELNRVRAELDSRRTLRVPEDVQEFVDATTVDLATFAAIVHETDPGASEELTEIVKRVQAAYGWKAELTKQLARPRRSTYSDLCRLTTLDEPDDFPSTRFIERPGTSYLLIDPSQVRPDLPSVCSLSARHLQNATAAVVPDALSAVVPVSAGELNDDMQALHEHTLAAERLATWDPGSRMLQRLFPVDVSLFTSAVAYDRVFGLHRPFEEDSPC